MVREIAVQEFSTSHKTKAAYSVLLTIFFSLAYIFFSPSIAYQHWDSLNYAYSIETDGIKWIWGNHPLGHVLFSLVYSFITNLGYTGRALPLFQIVNSIVSSVSVGLFFLFSVYGLKIKLSNSFGLAIILGSSYSFWHYAGTADIYSFALLLSLLSWISFVYEIQLKKRHFLILSGVLVGLATLAHQFNILLIMVPCVFIIYQRNTIPNTIIRILYFLGIVGVVIFLGYLLFGYLANHTLSLSAIFSWSKGHFVNPSYGIYFNSENIQVAWSAALQSILSFGLNQVSEIVRIGLLSLLFCTLIWGVVRYKFLNNHKPILAAALVQCFISWLLILWWMPDNLKFWLLPLIPFVISLGCCSIVIDKEIRKILSKYIPDNFKILHNSLLSILPVFGIVVLAFNFNSRISSEHKPNLVFEQAIHLWENHSAQDNILITTNELIPHLLYWLNRPNTINLSASIQKSKFYNNTTDVFQDMREKINTALSTGTQVLIAPDAVDYVSDLVLSLVDTNRESLKFFFDSYSKEEVFVYTNPVDLKRIKVYKLRLI